MRWDYPSLDINPVFSGLRVISISWSRGTYHYYYYYCYYYYYFYYHYYSLLSLSLWLLLLLSILLCILLWWGAHYESRVKLFTGSTLLFLTVYDPNMLADQLDKDLKKNWDLVYKWKIFGFNPDLSKQAQEVKTNKRPYFYF